MPKEYPLFIIDRNRRSRDANHQFDYLVCLDREVGFVAKVVLFKREAYEAYLKSISSSEDIQVGQCSMWLKGGVAGLVIVIVDYMQYFDWNAQTQARISSLLKKGLKKYLHAEVLTVTSSKEFSIDNQVKVLEDISKDLKAGYEKMVNHMGEDNAKFYIGCVEKSIESIKMLGKLVD